MRRTGTNEPTPCSVHGSTPEEVRRDLEGLQVMRTLENIAWMLKTIQAANIPVPKEEEWMRTDFIL